MDSNQGHCLFDKIELNKNLIDAILKSGKIRTFDTFRRKYEKLPISVKGNCTPRLLHNLAAHDMEGNKDEFLIEVLTFIVSQNITGVVFWDPEGICVLELQEFLC